MHITGDLFLIAVFLLVIFVLLKFLKLWFCSSGVTPLHSDDGWPMDEVDQFERDKQFDDGEVK